MSIHLAGGGWPFEDEGAVFRPFLDEITQRAVEAGRLDGPRLAIVLVRDGDGPEKFVELSAVLGALGKIDPVAVLAPEGAPVDVSLLDDIDGILVWGGLVPAYRESLSGAFETIRSLVSGGVAYFGMSAGAAVASDAALVGGWQIGDVQVCPAQASQELEQVVVAEGIGLIDTTVEVHAAQWGTVGRLIAATEAGVADGGVAIDEHTVLIVGDGSARVVGRGSVWNITRDSGSVRVSTIGIG
jgi:cyanophycinase